MEPLVIIVPLTALEYAYTAYQSVPSYEAAEMVKKQGTQPPVTPESSGVQMTF